MKNVSKKSFKKSILLGGAIGLISLTGVGTAYAHDSETRQAIRAAVEGNDYQAFQSAAADTKLIEKISSEELFSKLVEAKKLKESGDIEGAKTIKDELGLKHHGKNHDHNPEARAAVDNADYQAFVAATEGKRIAEKIDSEEKFTKLVEANTLRDSGDYEGARAIMEELGLKKHGKRGGKHLHDRGSDNN